MKYKTILTVCGLIAATILLSLGLVACGGGGSGSSGSITVTGIVLDVETGAPTNPQSSVQAGSLSTLTSAVDGSFSLNVPSGTSSLSVDTNGPDGVFTFAIPPATATEDVGDLYVGPNKVTVTGTVVDASNNNPVQGATIDFAGVLGTTNASGNFSLANVAYPNSSFAAFQGIVGSVRDPNYFAGTFNLSNATLTGGSIDAGTILLTPLSSTTPPPPPGDLYGTVTPAALGANSTVTVSQNGTPFRQTAADNTGSYSFWLPPGTYSISAVNGTHSSTPVNVTIASTTDIHQLNLTIN